MDYDFLGRFFVEHVYNCQDKYLEDFKKRKRKLPDNVARDSFMSQIETFNRFLNGNKLNLTEFPKWEDKKIKELFYHTSLNQSDTIISLSTIIGYIITKIMKDKKFYTVGKSNLKIGYYKEEDLYRTI